MMQRRPLISSCAVRRDDMFIIYGEPGDNFAAARFGHGTHSGAGMVVIINFRPYFA